MIDMDEMAAIIETLDCIEGVKPGELVRGLKNRYFGISIPIKYSNSSRFYKKNGSIL